MYQCRMQTPLTYPKECMDQRRTCYPPSKKKIKNRFPFGHRPHNNLTRRPPRPSLPPNGQRSGFFLFSCAAPPSLSVARAVEKTFPMSPPTLPTTARLPFWRHFFSFFFLGWTSVGRSNFFSLAGATDPPAESDRVSAVAAEAEERGKKFFFLLLASSSSSSSFRRQENERISFLLLFLFVRNRCCARPSSKERQRISIP